MGNEKEHSLIDITINPSAGCTQNTCRKRKEYRKSFCFHKFRKFFLIIFVLFIALLTGIIAYYSKPAIQQYGALTRLIDRILDNRYHELMTAPFVLDIGMDLDSAKILERLLELGYQRSGDANCPEGWFFIDGGEFYLSLHAGNGTTQKVLMRLKGSVITGITDIPSKKEITSITLEPLILTSFLDRIWEIRVPKTYDQIPQDLINAVLATEDQKYFQHPGVDAVSILRAAWVNFKAGYVKQGGSTVTQQLVKILLKRRERTIEKKYEEAILALALERKYTKKELLTVYLNNVYLGQTATFEIRGVAAASQSILGKGLDELSLKECALLGGLIRSPNSASPLRYPEKAARRTKTVLQQMAELGDALAAEVTIGKRLSRIRRQGLLHQQSWFFDQLEKELKNNRILPARFSAGQLKIHITLDPWIQTAAYQNMKEQIHALENKKKMATGTLQGAITILDADTGGIRAMVGGTNYLKSPFNRAMYAKRQIGSLIKPFIYLAALGGTGVHGQITQATILNDAPLQIKRGRSTWKPKNYDKKYKGKITARQALVESRNIPSILLGRMVGLEHIVSLVQELGITDTPPKVPALFLGACESTPVRMAGAFCTIANGGKRTLPHLISTIYQDEKILLEAPSPKPLLAPAPCYVVTDMLREVMISGTARRSRNMGFKQVAAGKTGTTNKLRDSWFAGYTPSMVNVVWVGRDNNKSSHFTGSTGALPLWVATMKAVLGKSLPQKFHSPKSVIYADIDPQNGKLARVVTVPQVKMAFVQGTAPTQYSLYSTPVIKKQSTAEKVAARPQKPKQKIHHIKRKPLKQRSEPWLISKLKRTADWFKRQETK